LVLAWRLTPPEQAWPARWLLICWPCDQVYDLLVQARSSGGRDPAELLIGPMAGWPSRQAPIALRQADYSYHICVLNPRRVSAFWKGASRLSATRGNEIEAPRRLLSLGQVRWQQVQLRGCGMPGWRQAWRLARQAGLAVGGGPNACLANRRGLFDAHEHYPGRAGRVESNRCFFKPRPGRCAWRGRPLPQQACVWLAYNKRMIVPASCAYYEQSLHAQA